MRKLVFLIFLITALEISQTLVYADTETDAYSKVYVPLPYILSIHQSLPQTSFASRTNTTDIDISQIDLSTITANRGVYSYALYRLLNPYEKLPPAITTEQKVKYGYDKYNEKRFEPVMKDYTIWAIESGYLSASGKANHLLSVKWQDIENLFEALQISPAVIEDYSIYDTDNWGFVTESEKATIGMFLAAFGRGIDTKSIEKQKFTLTIADMVYLAGALTLPVDIDIDDAEFHTLTGYNISFGTGVHPDNGAILSVCFPYARNSENKTVIYDLKKWAKKEGFINYEG